MPPLKCPFCCDTYFKSHDELKYHILSMIENIICPACNKRFDKFFDFINHLSTKCDTAVNNSESNNSKDESLSNTDLFSYYNNFQEDSTVFFCELCNVYVEEIEEHINQFHENDMVEVEGNPSAFSDDISYKKINIGTSQFCQTNTDTKLKPLVTAIEKEGTGGTTIETKSYKCPTCRNEFEKLTKYFLHSCTITAFPRCAVCDQTFLSYNLLEIHTKKHERGKEIRRKKPANGFECKKCLKVFLSKPALFGHQKIHGMKEKTIKKLLNNPENENFTCGVCNKSFSKKFEEIHKKSHESVFSCGLCNKEFQSLDELSLHLTVHSDKRFKCATCDMNFSSYADYNEHLKLHSSRLKYPCQFCERKFVKVTDKNRHERIHTGEKPFECDICSKRFRLKYSLTAHLRSHTGIRPYQCDKCDKSFKSGTTFNNHMLIHSKVKKFQCPFCPKAFCTAVQLGGHKNCHIRPFMCYVCNRRFASLYSVRVHMESHNKENNHLRYKCLICGALYVKCFAIRDHLRRDHQQEPSEKNWKDLAATLKVQDEMLEDEGNL